MENLKKIYYSLNENKTKLRLDQMKKLSRHFTRLKVETTIKKNLPIQSNQNNRKKTGVFSTEFYQNFKEELKPKPLELSKIQRKNCFQIPSEQEFS